MLSFLCISNNIDHSMSFNDIKEKDVVFTLDKPEPYLSKRILNEISGDKFSIVPSIGFHSFNLKTFVKRNFKIGGFSINLNSDIEIKNFLDHEKDLCVLLLDEEPMNNRLIMDYINRQQPKYIFYNSRTNIRKVVRNTNIIGISSFAVERYFPF